MDGLHTSATRKLASDADSYAAISVVEEPATCEATSASPCGIPSPATPNGVLAAPGSSITPNTDECHTTDQDVFAEVGPGTSRRQLDFEGAVTPSPPKDLPVCVTLRVLQYLDILGLGPTQVFTGPRGAKIYTNSNNQQAYVPFARLPDIYKCVKVNLEVSGSCAAQDVQQTPQLTNEIEDGFENEGGHGVAVTILAQQYLDIQGLGRTPISTGPRGAKIYTNSNKRQVYVPFARLADIYLHVDLDLGITRGGSRAVQHRQEPLAQLADVCVDYFGLEHVSAFEDGFDSGLSVAISARQFLDVGGLGEVEVSTGERGARWYYNSNYRRTYVPFQRLPDIQTSVELKLTPH